MLAAVVVMFLKNVFMNIFAPSLDKAAREGNEKMAAKVMAALVSTLEIIAKVVAIVVAVTGSAAITPPILTFPKKIASREAPIRIPVFISPIKIPVTRPTTSGRSIILWPGR